MGKKDVGSIVGGPASTQLTGEQQKKPSNMSEKNRGLKVPDVGVSSYE